MILEAPTLHALQGVVLVAGSMHRLHALPWLNAPNLGTSSVTIPVGSVTCSLAQARCANDAGAQTRAQYLRENPPKAIWPIDWILKPAAALWLRTTPSTLVSPEAVQHTSAASKCRGLCQRGPVAGAHTQQELALRPTTSAGLGALRWQRLVQGLHPGGQGLTALRAPIEGCVGSRPRLWNPVA